MLGLVFGIAGAIVVYIARMMRREERERLAREAKGSVPPASPPPP